MSLFVELLYTLFQDSINGFFLQNCFVIENSKVPFLVKINTKTKIYTKITHKDFGSVMPLIKQRRENKDLRLHAILPLLVYIFFIFE